MKHRYLKDAATLSFDITKCSGCGICTKVCPHQVLSLKAGRASIENKSACMECGACTINCPSSALSVQPGVGCAAAIIQSFFTGKEPVCGCSDSKDGCC